MRRLIPLLIAMAFALSAASCQLFSAPAMAGDETPDTSPDAADVGDDVGPMPPPEMVHE